MSSAQFIKFCMGLCTMNFLQKAFLLSVSAVSCLFAAAPEAAAFSLGVEIDDTPYKVSFSEQTFDSSSITFTDFDSAFEAAEAIVAALNNDIQDFSKSAGFGRASDDIYIPYGIKVDKQGRDRILTVRIREYKDGTDEAFYGTRKLKPEGEAIYANFKYAPEPLTILGSIAAVGMGVVIKRQRQAA